MADLTPEQIEEIRKYQDAFRQEFEVAQLSKPQQRQAVADDIQDQLEELVPEAVSTLKWIIKYSPSEASRLKATLWVLDHKLKAGLGDPLGAFVKEMEKSTTPPYQNAPQ